jgi:hypothetical protein
MATIFSSSDTAPLNSVIISSTTVTTLSILSRGWLFTVGFRSDCGWSYLRKLPCPRLLYLRCATSERRSERNAWSNSAGGEHTSGCSSGCSLRFPVLQLLPRVPAAPAVGRMRFFSLQQFAVATLWSGGGHSLCSWPSPHHKQRKGVCNWPRRARITGTCTR